MAGNPPQSEGVLRTKMRNRVAALPPTARDRYTTSRLGNGEQDEGVFEQPLGIQCGVSVFEGISLTNNVSSQSE